MFKITYNNSKLNRNIQKIIFKKFGFKIPFKDAVYWAGIAFPEKKVPIIETYHRKNEHQSRKQKKTIS